MAVCRSRSNSNSRRFVKSCSSNSPVPVYVATAVPASVLQSIDVKASLSSKISRPACAESDGQRCEEKPSVEEKRKGKIP
jgi:hypothetical protein